MIVFFCNGGGKKIVRKGKNASFPKKKKKSDYQHFLRSPLVKSRDCVVTS